MQINATKYAFIIGSPRSGTTLLGDILDIHPQITRWFEPYFILDHYFRDTPDDCRTSEDATDLVCRYIANAFEDYRRKSGCQIVVDKSPRNSLKIPFLLRIFPDAKFIHILRDGRDATLSIQKEWQRRTGIVSGNNKELLSMVKTINNNLIGKQQFLKYKLAALMFETGGPINLLKSRHFLHRLRWNGRIGWGPRFKGWQDIIYNVSTLEFNAFQWAKCVESIIYDSSNLDKKQYIEIRYEEFLCNPDEKLQEIFEFLDIKFPDDFMSRLPSLNRANFSKWKKSFSAGEKAVIGPIVDKLLIQLGYEDNSSWYTNI